MPCLGAERGDCGPGTERLWDNGQACIRILATQLCVCADGKAQGSSSLIAEESVLAVMLSLCLIYLTGTKLLSVWVPS